MGKSRQEKMIEMIKDFTNLSKENQVYVSGIIHGIYLQKEMAGKLEESA